MHKIIPLLLIIISGAAWANPQIEKAVQLFNQKEYQAAQTILQQEADKGSAKATFWLAVTQYKTGERFKAGNMFLKAANMGDPWAMGVLTGDYYTNNPCYFFGWPCSDDWSDKAIDVWHKAAQNGDGKAILQLQFFEGVWRQYIPILGRKLIDQKYIEAIYKGGYNATLYLNSYGAISQDDKVKHLTYAANQGYAPAMVSLYYYMDVIGEQEANKWANKAIKLGYAQAARAVHLAYYFGKRGHQEDNKKAFYFNELSRALGGETADPDLLINEVLFDEHGQPLTDLIDDNYVIRQKILITDEEQAAIKQQVADFIKEHNIKPNMFLDETSIDLF